MPHSRLARSFGGVGPKKDAVSENTLGRESVKPSRLRPFPPLLTLLRRRLIRGRWAGVAPGRGFAVLRCPEAADSLDRRHAQRLLRVLLKPPKTGTREACSPFAKNAASREAGLKSRRTPRGRKSRLRELPPCCRNFSKWLSLVLQVRVNGWSARAAIGGTFPWSAAFDHGRGTCQRLGSEGKKHEKK